MRANMHVNIVTVVLKNVEEVVTKISVVLVQIFRAQHLHHNLAQNTWS